MPKRTTTSIAIAALAVDLGGGEAPAEFRFIPAGEFRSRDGRPTECPAWVCTEEDGRRIVAELAAQSDAAVIDWEHATLRRKEIGKAPAAGWFKDAEWRDDGIWLKGVDWTALAAQEIVNKEYRYISPVFSYDQKTGRVGHVFHAALTNFAGIDGLTDLAACAAEVFDIANQTLTETPNMDELLEEMRWLLNLPVGATKEDILAQLQKIQEQIKTNAGTAVAANGCDLEMIVNGFAEAQTKIAALSAEVGSPDPAKFVPIAALSALQTEHATQGEELKALKEGVSVAALNAEIARGEELRKITPALKAWAADLGKSNLAALTAFIDSAPAVVPEGSQTNGQAPVGGDKHEQTPLAIAALAAEYQAEQANKGFSVTTVQAVAHVTQKKGA